MSTWTQKEKELLLVHLQKYGMDDLQRLVKSLPCRSLLDIKTLISKYENLAHKSMLENVSSVEISPIDKWINIARQISNQKLNNLVLSRVLKYIALYEKRIHTRVNIRYVSVLDFKIKCFIYDFFLVLCMLIYKFSI